MRAFPWYIHHLVVDAGVSEQPPSRHHCKLLDEERNRQKEQAMLRSSKQVMNISTQKKKKPCLGSVINGLMRLTTYEIPGRVMVK